MLFVNYGIIGIRKMILHATKIRNDWSNIFSIRDGVEDTRLEAKDTKKNPRPRTALPRIDPLEAKDKNAQGHRRKCSPKKKVFKKLFQTFSTKKKKVFKNFFQAIYKILIQKIVLSSSRRQGNFRGLEASRPRT